MTGTRVGRVVLLGILLLVAACSDAQSGGSGAGRVEDTLPLGSGDQPGTVIAAEPLPGRFGEAAWRVEYRSVDLDGSPTTVTGIIARPDGPPPEGGYPVLSFGHGTMGLADACAPSELLVGLDPVVGRFVEAGWVVAASDYEGMGGPGVHPYLVAESEARSMLDAARAAVALVPDTSADVVLHGASQGGHAALAAASSAEDLAPELDILGTIAMAPAADVGYFLDAGFRDRDFVVFTVMIAAAWDASYDDLTADELLTPAGVELAAAAVDDVCVAGLFRRAGDERRVRAPAEVPSRWAEVAAENSIDGSRVPGPLLLAHGRRDEVVDPAVSEAVVEELCGAGGVVELRRYDADHGGVVAASLEDTVAWAVARLDGETPATTC